jgi:hypothetical protein
VHAAIECREESGERKGRGMRKHKSLIHVGEELAASIHRWAA